MMTIVQNCHDNGLYIEDDDEAEAALADCEVAGLGEQEESNPEGELK